MWLAFFIHLRIRKICSGHVYVSSSESVGRKIFLGLSFLIATTERFEILSAAAPRTFAGFEGTDINLRVYDASDPSWACQTQPLIKRYYRSNLDYEVRPGTFLEHWLDLLRKSDTPYFAMLFDDQAVYGLTPSFLCAACQLLTDFKGLVDLVHVDYKYPYSIDDDKRTVSVNLDRPQWKQCKRTPVGTVRYGEHTFDILEKWDYGFIADVIIASRTDYQRRLEWYMNNVSPDSVHAIEVAAYDLRVGPVYHYYAVPRDAFFLDIDFQHTTAAVRADESRSRKLYEAVRDGYAVCLGDTTVNKTEVIS